MVAVGLLVANWDKLVKLFKKSEPETQKLIESNDTLTKGFEEQNRKLENEITMMQADGASADEVNAKKQALIATQIAETRATIEETKAKIAQIGKHSLLGRILRGENKEFKGLKETLEELEKTETKLVQSEEKINANAYADRRNKAKAAAEKEIEEVKRVLKEVEDASKKETDKLTEKYQKELKLLKKHNKDTAALTAKYNKELAELNRKSEKEIESAVASANDKISQYYTKFGLKNELEGAKKRLDEFNTLAKKDFPPKGLIETVLAGKDIKEVFGDMYDEAAKEAKKLDLITTDSAEEFVSAWIGAYEQWKDARLKLNTYDEQYAKEMKENYFNYIDEIRKKWQSTDSIFEEVKRNGMATVDWNLFNRRDPVKIELEFELANEKTTLESVKRTIGSLYDEANKIATNNFGFDFQLVPDDDSLETLKSLIGESQELEQIYEKIYEYTQKANEAQGNIAGIEKEIEARKSYMKYVQDQIREVNSENQNIGIISTKNFNEYYEARIQTAIDYIDYVKKLEYDSEQERQLALAEAYAQETEAEREYFQARLNNHLEFVNQVANVYGSIADILDESIQHQKDNLIAQGKTEEEANKMLEGKFEYVKGFQIAQAVINTISGALAAFTASQELGQPWGMAIGIAQAAAVTAAGVAQIQKIANTEIGSTSSSVGTVTANSTPKLLDYQPSTTQNITGASDEEKLQKTLENTQIWVSVKDINSAQDRGRTRVAEASF